MLDNYYIYKKEVDWSLLNQGFSIPLDIQVLHTQFGRHGKLVLY